MGISARSRSSKQRGFMTVMFLILMGLYLTFAAFALDLGNLYLWKLRLDKASRAGALAGLGQRGLEGHWVASGREGASRTREAALSATMDTLKSYGTEVQSAIRTDQTRYDSTGDQLSMVVTYDVPTILVGRLTNVLGYGFNPHAGETPNSKITLTSTHTSTLKPVNIVLALDVSGSMLCPVVGSCECRRTGTCTGETKLQRLVQGVRLFVRHFNPDRDRIAVIPFNLGAQRLYSLLDAGGQPVSLRNSPSLNPAVTSSTAWNFFAEAQQSKDISDPFEISLAGGNTNHCDALAEAIRELESLGQRMGLPGNANERTQIQPFVVFFTDGAPNAMRGIFNQNLQCLTYSGGSYNGTPTSCGANPDMYHYGLEWVATTATTPATTTQYRGPGPFVVRSETGGIPAIFRHNITATTVAPNGSQVCGQHIADPTQFESTIVNQHGEGQQRRISGTGCLPTSTGPSGTFNFAIPYTNFDDASNSFTGGYRATVSNVPISTSNTTWWDRNWPASFLATLPANAVYGVQKYDELPYYCAIEAADYLRTRFGATIFTVGLGPPGVHDAGGASNSASCDDPLQDADDHVSRKDFFLSRLAFARQMFADPALPVEVQNHYIFRGGQQNRSVVSCQRGDGTPHRLRQNDLAGRTPPQVRIGFVANSGLMDGSTTYQDLRPFKPLWMDGQATSQTAANRRRIDTQGEYFPTDRAQDVPAIFAAIAKSILLRSTS